MAAAVGYARRTRTCRAPSRSPSPARVRTRMVGPVPFQDLQRSLGNRAAERVLRAAISDTASSPQPTSTTDRDLQSPRFAADPVLEACLDRKRVLRSGDSGEAVFKIQQALLDAGFPLPAFGADGKFGAETKSGVHDFQAESGLTGKALDGIVGPTTMALLDARFPGAPPQPGACPDSAIDNTKDPLPAIPVPSVTKASVPEVLAEVKRLQPPGLPIPKVPLGASQPTFSRNPVRVTTEGAADSMCRKCVADWDITPAFRILMAVGSFVSDEPRRFGAIQQGDESGCPSRPIPELLDVRMAIQSDAEPFSFAGELEHFMDFVRAFRLAGCRYLANVRRLTGDRSHLFGKDQADCESKVGNFLGEMLGLELLIGGLFLPLYADVFAEDFNEMFRSPRRDESKQHDAVPRPDVDTKPIFPNIDLQKNPFGCNAFARKFDARSFPRIPGESSETAVIDTNQPPKKPWHVL